MQQINTNKTIIEKTKGWIERVVIGCNFCPFARKVFVEQSIHYEVISAANLQAQLAGILSEMERLDRHPEIETSLLIFPDQYPDFEDYLDLLSLAVGLLSAHGYEGVYQVASFHPKYIFAQSTEDDPANFTNRSPYPMLHLIRESSLSAAIEAYPDVEKVPERNIAFARMMGFEKMKRLMDGR